MRLLAICWASLVAATGFAGPLPVIAPERAGFSKEGLSRIDKFFEREIAANRVPGAVVGSGRDGKLVYYEAQGFLNRASNEPMVLDAIFNLASMTKVMACVGGLVLNEEGRLPLKSRLDGYFPSFGKMTVWTSLGAEAKNEAANPIYIHDLVRHTSRIPYGWPSHTPVHNR